MERPFTFAAAVAAFALQAGAQNVEAPPQLRAARDAVAAEVERGYTPSIAVAVLQHGAVVWAEGFGLAERAHERAATADTIYRLASISKTFTATALMQLVDRGRIELDAPVDRYLDVPLIARAGSAEQITVRRLLNHTGGLPTHWNFFFGDEHAPPRADSIRAYGFAAFEPGTRTNYCNFAFGVLDHVIARLGGKSYRDWLVTELLDPLGMADTDVGVRPGRELRAALGYRKAKGEWTAIDDYGFDHDGASAVRSSANDLMRFARLQLGRGEVDGRRLLSEASTLAMRKPTARAVGSTFGIGWSVGRERGQAVLRHSGGMPGVSTQLLVFPAREAAFAVLTNGDDRGATNRAVNAVLDAMFGAPSGEATNAKPPAAGDADRPAETVAAAGRYRGDILHPDGSVPVALEVTAAAARIAFDGGEPQECRMRASASALTLQCTHRLPVGHRGNPDTSLTFELAPAPLGLCGVLYATVDGVCRLPFWVELAREADANGKR